MSKIILSRTDSIGDVVLTLPMAGLLKQIFPGTEIIFLGTDYTLPVIRAAEFIDRSYSWDMIKSQSDEVLTGFFRDLKADTLLHVFPNRRLAIAAKNAGIPLRIGTSHRFFHLMTCNKIVNFSRRKSDLHEMQLNVKLLKPLGIDHIPDLSKMKTLYGLKPHYPIPRWLQEIIDPYSLNIIIHPKSKGSAREWSLVKYQALIDLLVVKKYKVYITGTETERNSMGDFLDANREKVFDLTGKLTLEELIGFINSVQGLISCSTGPLHIAAALGKVAIGIYPPIKPMHPGRWAPIGKKASFIVAEKNCGKCRQGGYCECIDSISAYDVFTALNSMVRT